MQEEKIDILLACYNGEKYIYNQILSLLQQTHTNWHLYIRDDGSSDNTLNIINEFIDQDDRITLIKDDKKGLGAALNFKELFNYITSEYAICCDQDDIWFEKKLELLLNKAKSEFSREAPCMVYCDGYGYDSTEGIISHETISSLQANDLSEFIFFNGGYQGCSILFNKKLAEYFINYKAPFYMHDDIISLIAFTFGKAYFLPKKLMLYRQHGNNVTGNMTKDSVFKRALYSEHPVITKIHLKEKQDFYQNYSQVIDEKNKEVFNAFFKIAFSKNLLKKLWLTYQYRFSLGQYRLRLFLKLIMKPTLK